MTYLDNSPVRSRSSAWSEWARRCSQRRHVQTRYWCVWIVAALFSFTVFRMVYLCDISSIKEKSSELAAHGHSSVTSVRFSDISILGGKFFSSHKSRLIRTDESTWTTLHDRVSIENNQMKKYEAKIVGGSERKQAMKFKGKHSSGQLPILEYLASHEGERKAGEFEEKPVAELSIETQDEGSFGLPENIDDIAPVTLSNGENQEEKQVKKPIEEKQTGEDPTAAGDTAEEGHSWRGEDNRIGEVTAPDAGEKVDKSQQDGGSVTEEVTDHTQGGQEDEGRPAGKCDLFDGDWAWDPEGPLYTNSTCFYMQVFQDCMSNGRPDTDYLHWKWKPRDCDLPRFDARVFLETFKGKSIGFAGDSLARNQMQSLLCMLSQIEVPRMHYQSDDDSTVRWFFEHHQVTLSVVWSPYLLKESREGIMGFDKGQSVLYLDVLDTAWTSVMKDFDIIVLSIGQWYFKRSVYVKQDEVVGCHFCPGLNLTEISPQESYRGAIRQVLEKVAAEFKGIAIMSTFALSHFEDGLWNTGGQCNRGRPLDRDVAAKFPGMHNEMHDIVMDEFNRIAYDKNKLNENVKLEFLDVTKVSLTRADGHPGPYRTPNPSEGKNSDEWVPNDCLHWCLPGPVDTWNQLLAKIVNDILTTSQTYASHFG